MVGFHILLSLSILILSNGPSSPQGDWVGGGGGIFSSCIMNSLIYFELLKWLPFQDLECLTNAFLLNGLQHKDSKTDAISCVCLFNH